MDSCKPGLVRLVLDGEVDSRLRRWLAGQCGGPQGEGATIMGRGPPGILSGVDPVLPAQTPDNLLG